MRRKLPFLRWSVIRMALGARHLLRTWQVGDGREEALARHVLAHARQGSVADVIRVIDAFSYERSLLMNVGDEKGAILDAAVARAGARRILELGTYCGYSAARIAAAAPAARVVSVEWSPANAAIARRILGHAGVLDRVEVVVGSLGDGATVDALARDHGLAPGAVDLVFLDHDKDAYLPDLERILAAGWLRTGGLVVADNVGFPGAPAYRAHMRASEGSRWRTTEHRTHAEYQTLIRDLVLVSELLPSVSAPAAASRS